jgi:hypothetical protein
MSLTKLSLAGNILIIPGQPERVWLDIPAGDGKIHKLFLQCTFTNVWHICFSTKETSDSCAGIFKQSMGDSNRVGIWLLYQPAWLHRVAELIPWNRFLGSLKV